MLFTIVSAVAENSQVAVLDLTTGQQKILIRGGSHAEYVDPGFLVYGVAGTLRAVRFDLQTLEVQGDAVPVADRLTMGANGSAQFAASTTGSLVYAPGSYNLEGTTPTFSRGNPRKLFELGRIFVGTASGRSWDVSRDGRRFIAIRHEAATATTGTDRPSFVFIVNLAEELRGKLGVNR